MNEKIKMVTMQNQGKIRSNVGYKTTSEGAE